MTVPLAFLPVSLTVETLDDRIRRSARHAWTALERRYVGDWSREQLELALGHYLFGLTWAAGDPAWPAPQVARLRRLLDDLLGCGASARVFCAVPPQGAELFGRIIQGIEAAGQREGEALQVTHQEHLAGLSRPLAPQPFTKKEKQ